MNLQVGCVRVDLARNHLGFAMSIEVDLSKNFEFELSLPSDLIHGVYLLADLRALEIEHLDATPNMSNQVSILGNDQSIEERAFFVKVPSSTRSAAEEVNYLLKLRQARIHSRVEVSSTAGPLTLRVAYLYSGLLVHASQHCEGYSIIPYGSGLSPLSEQEALNAFSSEAFSAQFEVSIEQAGQYASNKPLAAILFHNVGAATVDDALLGVRPRVDDIVLALAFDRGYRPEPFAAIVSDGTSSTMWLLHHPYTGNLFLPFGSSEIGDHIERLTAAMNNSPFQKLVLELYVQGISEKDQMFRVFRYWSILELLAKRAIPDNHHHIYDAHGARIMLSNGNPVTTSKSEAKVYKYLFDQGLGNSNTGVSKAGKMFSVVTEGSTPVSPLVGNEVLLTLWQVVQAFYAIRNAVAHEGRFSPLSQSGAVSGNVLASRVLELLGLNFYYAIENMTQVAVLRSLRQSSGSPH